MRLRTFALTSATYAAVPLVGRFLSLAVLPVMTRYLSPEDYGIILLVANGLSLLTLGLTLGVDQAFAIYFVQAKTFEERQVIASTVLWFRVAVFGGATAAVVLFAGSIGELLLSDARATAVIYLAIAGFFVLMLSDHFSTILRLLERHRPRILLETAKAVVATLAMLVFVVKGWGVEGYYVGTLVAYLVFMAIFFHQARDYVSLSGSMDSLRSMIKFGAPLITSNLGAYTVQNTASFFIKATDTLARVGLYSTATQLSGAVALVSNGFGQVWVPYVYRSHQEPGAKEDIAKIFRLYNAALMGVGMGLAVLSRELLIILAHPSFHPAYVYVPLLALNQITNSIAGRFGVGITISGHTWHRIWINAIHVGSFVLPALLLSPKFGIWAVILSQVFANVVLGILVQIVSQRLVYFPYGWRHTLALWAGACLVVFGLMEWAQRAAEGLDWMVIGGKLLGVTAFMVLPVMSGYVPLPTAWERRLRFLPRWR